MVRLSWAVATHPGLRRGSNEDAHAARPDLGLFIVADGMGGHAAGEVASRAAADTIEVFTQDTRSRDLNITWPFSFDPALSIDANRLTAAFRLANRHIADRVAAEQELRGMATTVSAVLLHETGSGAVQGVIGHVGDSRVYLYRGGELRQVTDDHSWVGEQIRAGVMTDADARRHPWRNVVTRAISGGADPDVDVVELPLQAGDRLLLCSDGLSGVVLEDVIAALMSGGTLESTCEALIAAANDAGGPDNITTVLIQID
ncbi:MAG: protein phosphatase 2C domain-containing protein [Acidobacteriota bacterium]|nr:protein phosphatase 2C domain-containing protein [Acidobacteriota bacterium]